MAKYSFALVNLDNAQIRIVRNLNKNIGTDGAYTTEFTVNGRLQIVEKDFKNLNEAWSYVTGKVMLANGG